MRRRPNFIDKLPNDKKSHLVLGLVINPVIFTILINHNLYALIICIFIHGGIEIYQRITKTGKAEWLDFVSGVYSALWFWFLIELSRMFE
jgi:hypothetical protein